MNIGCILFNCIAIDLESVFLLGIELPCTSNTRDGSQ